ncbi:hypothetical protein D6821_01900, partial [Candidatus Parcubacteria bacterium]
MILFAQKHFTSIFLTLALLFLIVFFTNSGATKTRDAIGIRIMPNPQFYDIQTWYKEQRFKGSPQLLLVDGYEAIRDGRTVYINAANVEDVNGTPSNPDDDKLYLNVYIVSYTQDSNDNTVDIFAQILQHWQFNTNLNEPDHCNGTPGLRCLKDSECPSGSYCLSQKARLIRDIRRMLDLAKTKSQVESYYQQYSKFPTLKSGTYVPNYTLSVWPSWQRQLANQLGVKLPVDPINKLGDCGGSNFDPITCWDNISKRFAYPLPNLPPGSHVYVYSASQYGDEFNLCSLPETNYAEIVDKIKCSSVPSFFSGEVSNQAPTILVPTVLSGRMGEDFEVYIRAQDLDENELRWSIDTSPATQWSSWHGGSPPTLEFVSNSLVRLYSPLVGDEGEYYIQITVDDQQGKPNSVVTKNLIIKIRNTAPHIIAPDITYTPHSLSAFQYFVIARDDDASYPLTYELVPPHPPIPTGLSVVPPIGGNMDFYAATNDYRVKITGIIDPSFFSGPYSFEGRIQVDLSYRIKVTDRFGEYSTKDFVFSFVNHPPQIRMPSEVSILTGSNKLNISPINI